MTITVNEKFVEYACKMSALAEQSIRDISRFLFEAGGTLIIEENSGNKKTIKNESELNEYISNRK